MFDDSEAGRMYKSKFYYKISVFLVLVGGINWLTAVFMKKDVLQTFLGNNIFTKAIYLAVGISAIMLFFNRDTYLPFLGETLVPCAAFATRTPDNANQEVTITVKPNTKVIYWATEPQDVSGNKGLLTWDQAYQDYSNSGVAISDATGKCILRIRGAPQTYTVPYKGTLKPHVHFRVCEKFGMMGPVQTYYLENGNIEKFTI
jgi:uncharacterized membrane protein YuzA (DUF378 family)